MTVGPEDGMAREEIWLAAQDELRFQVPRPGYETWLANAVLLDGDGDGRVFTLGVPTRLARDWLRERYVPLIREILTGLLLHDCEVIVTVDPASRPPRDEPLAAPEAEPPPAFSGLHSDGATDSRLNPNSTFSTFVVGNNSSFAHAACRAVADAPGKAYNPLFLYGGVGLGKTHLMHAIGHAVRHGQSRAPMVAYITSEKFLNELVAAIRENRTHDFRLRYRTVDVLLIDDIQFLVNRDRTQEEFFHTFNALHEIQKQIVISSDRPPKEIGLESRLRSRFEGGLTVDIQPPDFETRLAILNSKLGDDSRLVHADVCSFIAHKIQRNIRELEGALIRVRAHAMIHGEIVDLETAHRILRDKIPLGDEQPLTIAAIQEVVADYYNITLEEMKSKRRDQHIVFPRQVAMYLIREQTESSLPVIGKAFGNRDHTTALHSIEKIDELQRDDSRLQAELRDINERLRGR